MTFLVFTVLPAPDSPKLKSWVSSSSLINLGSFFGVKNEYQGSNKGESGQQGSLTSNQHRLIFTIYQHVGIGVISNGEKMWRDFRSTFSFIRDPQAIGLFPYPFFRLTPVSNRDRIYFCPRRTVRGSLSFIGSNDDWVIYWEHFIWIDRYTEETRICINQEPSISLAQIIQNCWFRKICQIGHIFIDIVLYQFSNP